MKKRFTGILSGLLAAVFILSLFSVSAISFEGAPEVSSTAAVLYNLEAEEIVYSKNMDGRLDPAAFTKLMTALLAFEYRAQNGNINVTVTAEMLSAAGGTSMRLKEGEILPFDSLLAGLVVQNANDAALVLASTVGGNIMSFVDLMNERAKQMGMENTYFSNPTGVDSASMYTTMQDVLTLCKAVYRINDFMLLSENPKISIPATNLSIQRSYTNKNALIPYSYVTDYYMENVRGMIAGYTPRAGYCVATVREIKGSKSLVIISGGVDRSERKNGTDISSYREAKALLEWSEANFGMRRAMEQGRVVCERKVRLASGVDHMILVTGAELEKLLPLDADLSKEITTVVRTDREVFTAPIIEGTAYGELDVLYQGEVIGTVPLVAKSNLRLSRWLVAWDAVVSFFSHGPAKVVLILAI
ncbi:MAG: D-alanyl-D-alanine carboxypeptidase, partial [Clostridia bacterium]|nr:D-alanyl-D-alanine carboxypeptidase [Clostridia bacterium]